MEVKVQLKRQAHHVRRNFHYVRSDSQCHTVPSSTNHQDISITHRGGETLWSLDDNEIGCIKPRMGWLCPKVLENYLSQLLRCRNPTMWYMLYAGSLASRGRSQQKDIVSCEVWWIFKSTHGSRLSPDLRLFPMNLNQRSQNFKAIVGVESGTVPPLMLSVKFQRSYVLNNICPPPSSSACFAGSGCVVFQNSTVRGIPPYTWGSRDGLRLGCAITNILYMPRSQGTHIASVPVSLRGNYDIDFSLRGT